MADPASLPQRAPAGIGLFDLDGTLIAWDCQLLFRHFVVRREPLRGLLLPLFLLFVPLAKLLGAATMKRIFLCYLCGMDPQRLRAYAAEFAREILPGIYPEVRALLDEHRAKGHFTILSSASPEIYVREIGRELGFDLSLGTVVDFGPLFPDLENHKGEAKVWRLRELLPPAWFEGGRLPQAHGYSDSTADLPMLRICAAATVVNPGRELREIAASEGWQVVQPRRPWRNRLGLLARVSGLLLGVGRDPAGILKAPPGKNRA